MSKILYLAHSVHERQRGKRIQKRLEEMGFIVYNPFYPEDPRAYRKDIAALDGGHIVPWDVKDSISADWIITTDLRGVGNADFIVCIFPRRRTVGISCEMAIAWMLHIPVYSLTPEDMKGHPWIVGMSYFTETDLERLLWDIRTYEGEYDGEEKEEDNSGGKDTDGEEGGKGLSRFPDEGGAGEKHHSENS